MTSSSSINAGQGHPPQLPATTNPPPLSAFTGAGSGSFSMLANPASLIAGALHTPTAVEHSATNSPLSLFSMDFSNIFNPSNLYSYNSAQTGTWDGFNLLTTSDNGLISTTTTGDDPFGLSGLAAAGNSLLLNNMNFMGRGNNAASSNSSSNSSNNSFFNALSIFQALQSINNPTATLSSDAPATSLSLPTTSSSSQDIENGFLQALIAFATAGNDDKKESKPTVILDSTDSSSQSKGHGQRVYLDSWDEALTPKRGRGNSNASNSNSSSNANANSSASNNNSNANVSNSNSSSNANSNSNTNANSNSNSNSNSNANSNANANQNSAPLTAAQHQQLANQIINHLNQGGGYSAEFDTNKDGAVTPLDALIHINAASTANNNANHNVNANNNPNENQPHNNVPVSNVAGAPSTSFSITVSGNDNGISFGGTIGHGFSHGATAKNVMHSMVELYQDPTFAARSAAGASFFDHMDRYYAYIDTKPDNRLSEDELRQFAGADGLITNSDFTRLG